mgnify:FL=1|jgi:hypothetical protein|tara:strand:- start:2803 stop:3042 length:240 start_codon:yes stop_codon:yes gene_type:complete
MLKWDGFDNAIIGVGERNNTDSMIVYDYDKMVKVLVTRDDMSYEEAEEYIDYNVIGAWIGDTTPIIVSKKSIKEIEEEY